MLIRLGDGTTENINIDTDADIHGRETMRLVSIVWKGFIFYTLHNDLSVAIISGIEFKDSHVKAFAFNRGTFFNIKIYIYIYQFEIINDLNFS